MKSRDGRKLSRDRLEYIRINSCQRVRAGEKPSAVIKTLGLCRTSIYRWLRIKRAGGEKALKQRKATGRKRLLRETQQHQLRNWIIKKDPRWFGFMPALWTRRIISHLVFDKFKVKMSITAVGELLFYLGITPQKPLRRAYERNEREIRRWKIKEYPQLKKRAKQRNAQLLFLDEAGIQSDPALGATWGKRGKTPIVRTSGQRQQINVVSAVSPYGAFRFILYPDKLNAEFFIEILKNFAKRSDRPIFFIVDGHPAHRANIVKKFVASMKGKIELHFLPPYAPDLNPDEFVWNHIKKNGVSKKPLRQNESLVERVSDDLINLKKDPALIRSFFKAESVAYISA